MSISKEELEKIMEKKGKMRREAYDRRNAQENKDEISAEAVKLFMALPEYQKANTIMWYIDCRSETRTKPELLAEVKKGEKKIIVPYCTEDENGENKLGLWHMESLEEMVVGKWNILEPPKELWGNPEKEVTPEDLDMIMVPGVGFDRNGGRMGNGQGYYDRTMEKVRPDCSLIALCYETQLFDEILVAPHDVYMDKVVTEKEVYIGKGRD
ncbi:MAG: 5-formyltetrahydrofolate cyclo-ligase [Pseudomonadota bacterium]|nr:5-formyltetrahydrofolate cyclo-ligase [Pseudomonadota bacterium]|tara:strand:+ start:6296 stop:6928 length:633 start_codon:yes stop_codon:yes gene_type:complete